MIFTAVVTLRVESDLGVEGIGKFDREACFANLLRVGGRKAHKLRPHIANNEKIAARSVVIAQPQIGADGLGVLFPSCGTPREAPLCPWAPAAHGNAKVATIGKPQKYDLEDLLNI